MVNRKYSGRDFTDVRLTDKSSKEFNGTEIRNSCFYQQYIPGKTPPYDVFPRDMTNVHFVCCNLDNVKIPKECTLEKCTNKIIIPQNDLTDWFCDSNGNPIEPLDKRKRIKLKLPYGPDSIPLTKAEQRPVQAKLDELREQVKKAQKIVTKSILSSLKELG